MPAAATEATGTDALAATEATGTAAARTAAARFGGRRATPQRAISDPYLPAVGVASLLRSTANGRGALPPQRGFVEEAE
ncbi:MAG: hypothetical protein NVS2B6_11320 [Thermoleophilaceae bacterium]